MENQAFVLNGRLNSIKVAKFALSNGLSNIKIDQEKLTFEFTSNVQISPVSRTITITVSTKFFLDGTKSFQLSELEVLVEYGITNLEEGLKKENSVEFNNTITTLIGIAISTSRGIFFERTIGTPLEGIYIPIIDLRSLRPQT